MNIHDDDDDERHHPKEYSEWPKKKKFHSGFNTVKKNIEIEIQFHSIFFLSRTWLNYFQTNISIMAVDVDVGK